MSVLEKHVLVLNRLYQAVNIISLKDAMIILSKDHAKVVDKDYQMYSFNEWLTVKATANDIVVRTAIRHIKAPKIIKLELYDKIPGMAVRFSRLNIYERDKYMCQYCYNIFRQRDLTLDHVLPKSRGGKSTWDNVVCACMECNSKKADRTPIEAGFKLLKKPKKPPWIPFIKMRFQSIVDKEWLPFLEIANGFNQN